MYNNDLNDKVDLPVIYHERGNKTFNGTDQVIASIAINSNHYAIVTAGCEFVNVNVDHIRIINRATADIMGSLNSFGAITAVLTEGVYDVHIKTSASGTNPFILTKVTFSK